MKKRNINYLLLSLFLSITMILEPIGLTVPAYAAEQTASSMTTTVSEDRLPDELAQSSGQDSPLEIPAATEELLSCDTYCAFEQDYSLSSEQYQLKADSQSMLADFNSAEEGRDYIEDQVFYFAETIEEAEKIADAIHAELIEFAETVAIARVSEYSVKETVYAGLDMNSSLPVIYPDYIRQWDSFDVEYGNSKNQNEVIAGCMDEQAEQTLLDNEQMMITEETASLESDTHSYHAFYNDPALNPGNDYYQWHHATLETAEAWQSGYTGAGIIVGVIDSGIIDSHEDLVIAKRFDHSGNEVASLTDSVGHGTMVSGTICGIKNNSKGGVGIAPDATLYMFSCQNGTSPNDSSAITGINTYIREQVDVINMSFGGYHITTAYDNALEKAHAAGIIVVGSAGNSNTNSLNYPSSAKYVLSIASTDRDNKRASFSSYGPAIDLSAPGTAITTTSFNSSTSYSSVDGTSFSSPIIAGEAALILQAARANEIPQIPAQKGAKQADALEKYMKDKAFSVGSGMGAGIVCLPQALNISKSTMKPAAPVITIPKNIGNSQSINVTITAQTNSEIYYTTDGTTPTYPETGTTIKGNNPQQLQLNAGSLTRAPKYTISAIAVNSSGLVSAVKKVTVTLKPFVQDINLNLPVGGVPEIPQGKSFTVKPTVYPAFASIKKLEWSVQSTPKGAAANSLTVNNGKITASKTAPTGEYQIAVKAVDGSNTVRYFTINVIEKSYIASAKFNLKSLTVTHISDPLFYDPFADADLKLLAQTTGGSSCSFSDVLWSSSNTRVATIQSAQKQICILGPGKTVITALAKDGSGKKATLTIQVKQLPVSLKILPESPSADDKQIIARGCSAKLKATIYPDNATNRKVTWHVSSSPVSYVDITAAAAKEGLRINTNGTVSVAKNAPEKDYYVYASTVENKINSNIYTIHVAAGKVTKIKFLNKDEAASKASTIFRVKGDFFAPTSGTIYADISGTSGFRSDHYTIDVSDKNLIQVFSSQNTNRITLNVSATGKKSGSAKLTLRMLDGSNQKATYTIKVVNPASSLVIGCSSNGRILAGKSLKLTPHFGTMYGPLSSKKIKWSVSNPDYATITSNGTLKTKKIRGVNETTVTVTAVMDDGSNVTAVSEQIHINHSPVTGIYTQYNYGLLNSYTTYILSSSADIWQFPVSSSGICYGLQVETSNPKVLSAYYSGNALILRRNAKSGSVKVTIKAIDGGGGKKVTYKFVVK